MIEIQDLIKKKINDNIKPKSITLIDNSLHHKKHKSFDKNKYHFKIIIESDELKKIDKITAHKRIFSILKEEMIDKIHALEIEIK